MEQPPSSAASPRVAPLESAAETAPAPSSHPDDAAGATSMVSRAAIELVLTMRARQIDQYGHTPEADMARPIGALIKPASIYFQRLREDLSCNAPLDTLEKDAAALGAMVLAIIDRIQGEREKRNG